MLTFPFFDGSIHRLPVTIYLSGLERVEAMPQRKAVVTIAIVDDHPIVLDGLEYLFRREAGFEIVARCEAAEEAVRAVIEKQPDILILDVRMPVKDGLWVLEQTPDRDPTQVILLTAGVDQREIAKALKLGARGVVLKQRTREDLITCIREVRAGRRWIDEDILQNVVNLIRGSKHRTGIDATPSRRELEIIQLVARGLRNKEIAKKLSVSEGTVKTHLRSIFKKLSVSGRIELAIWARDNGLD
jgi:DNA-binding NarL/FixJ family response regulator